MKCKKLTCLLATVVAAAALASPLPADTFSYPATGQKLFSIDIPNGWKVEVEGDVLHSTPPDESIYVGLWALPYETLDAAAEALDEMVADLVSGFELKEEGEFTSNDVPFYFFDGSGEDKESGGPVNVSVALFSPDGDTFCMLIYFGSPRDEKRHEDALGRIVRSIRRP